MKFLYITAATFILIFSSNSFAVKNLDSFETDGVNTTSQEINESTNKINNSNKVTPDCSVPNSTTVSDLARGCLSEQNEIQNNYVIKKRQEMKDSSDAMEQKWKNYEECKRNNKKPFVCNKELLN